jgi:TPR repeat protein
LIILGSGLLIAGLAYGLLTGYQTWKQQQQQQIKTLVEQQTKAKQEETRKTTELAVEAEKNRRDAEQEQARLAEKAAQQAKAKQETARLEALQLAKAQLKSDDKTLWQAAINRLSSFESLDGEAMFLLGASYAKGDGGIKQDYKLACQWFKKAAEAGEQNGKQYADSKLCKKS